MRNYLPKIKALLLSAEHSRHFTLGIFIFAIIVVGALAIFIKNSQNILFEPNQTQNTTQSTSASKKQNLNEIAANPCGASCYRYNATADTCTSTCATGYKCTTSGCVASTATTTTKASTTCTAKNTGKTECVNGDLKAIWQKADCSTYYVTLVKACSTTSTTCTAKNTGKTECVNGDLKAIWQKADCSTYYVTLVKACSTTTTTKAGTNTMCSGTCYTTQNCGGDSSKKWNGGICTTGGKYCCVANTNCKGTCGDTAFQDCTASGGFQTGLCPGGTNIKCCPSPGTLSLKNLPTGGSTELCTKAKGTCVNPTTGCDNKTNVWNGFYCSDGGFYTSSSLCCMPRTTSTPPSNPGIPATPTSSSTTTSTTLPGGSTTTSTTIPAGSTILALTLGLDGIGTTGDNLNTDPKDSNKNPLHTTRNVNVIVSDQSGAEKINSNSSVVYNSGTGKFTGTVGLSNLATGSYIIKVKADGFLRKLIAGIQTITTGATNTMPLVNLVNGDIDNDNKLTIYDYNLLINCSSFNKDKISKSTPTCSSSVKLLADLDDNGTIDQYDYQLFIREFAVQSGSL
jgi:hypothetical protein